MLNDPNTCHSATLAESGILCSTPPGPGGARLRGERPPEPEEVYWDQLQFKMPELVRRAPVSGYGRTSYTRLMYAGKMLSFEVSAWDARPLWKSNRMCIAVLCAMVLALCR